MKSDTYEDLGQSTVVGQNYSIQLCSWNNSPYIGRASIDQVFSTDVGREALQCGS
jgi:hypothetical protein